MKFMARPDLPNFFIDLAKILGGVVRDSLDVGDYRITVIIERKIDDKEGIVIENLSIDKKMNAMQVGIVTKKFRELMIKESY